MYWFRSSSVARPLFVFHEGVRVVLGRLPCPLVCLCLRCCFVCLLVGRLVLSFSGVRCFCSCCFCFARVASFELFFCCGGAWGVLSCSFCWCQTCECVLLKESPAAAPSNQSSICPVCPVPASFFLVCRACMLVLCPHAPARIAFAAPLTIPVFCLIPLIIFYLTFSYRYLFLPLLSVTSGL